MIVLASASPRRRELITLISQEVKIHPSDVDETIPEGMPSESVPEYLAVKKAAAVAKEYLNDTVIGSDTSVIVDGIILGKPADREDAKRMLTLLSGKVHKVITGCAIFKGGKSLSFSEITEVEFHRLTDSEIEKYLDRDEYKDKAGAYGIQGYASLLVKGINGDYFNVVGLPVSRLSRVLERF